MMLIEKTAPGMYAATNTCKPVIFHETEAGGWLIHTPQGRLLDDVKAEGDFANLNAAVRYAETVVAMKMFLTESEG